MIFLGRLEQHTWQGCSIHKCSGSTVQDYRWTCWTMTPLLVSSNQALNWHRIWARNIAQSMLGISEMSLEVVVLLEFVRRPRRAVNASTPWFLPRRTTLKPGSLLKTSRTRKLRSKHSQLLPSCRVLTSWNKQLCWLRSLWVYETSVGRCHLIER